VEVSGFILLVLIWSDGYHPGQAGGKMAQALLAASGVSTGWVVDIAFAIPQVPAVAQAQRKNQADWLHEL
jgi:hypothetical protein